MKKTLSRYTKGHNDNLKILLLKEYKKVKLAISRRLKEFERVKEEDYFYELIYCLLTPQSSAKNANSAVEFLKELDFKNKDIDPEYVLERKQFYIRFHKTKARHLLELKEKFSLVHNYLKNGKEPFEIREWLVKNVKGLGYKEASHFLRNIGKKNLAILDRHILRNLYRLKVIREVPKSLTRKNYLLIEKSFKKFSDKIGIPMDELDLLFWSMETGEILK